MASKAFKVLKIVYAFPQKKKLASLYILSKVGDIHLFK